MVILFSSTVGLDPTVSSTKHMVRIHKPDYLRLLICLMLGCCLPFLSHGQSWDTQSYQGWRCGVMNVREVKVKSSSLTFVADIANTGKEALNFNDGAVQSAPVVFTTDAVFSSSELQDIRDEVAVAILSSGMRMEPGSVIRGRKFILDRKAWQEAKEAHQIEANSQSKIAEEAVEEITYFFSDTLDGCPNLILDTAWITRQKGKTIYTTIQITNIGTGPAILYKAGEREVGFGISFFWGNTPTISRSSRFIEGQLLEREKGAGDGILGPGESILHQTRFSRRGIPDFLHSLQMRADGLNFVEECDETDNEYVLPITLD